MSCVTYYCGHHKRWQLLTPAAGRGGEPLSGSSAPADYAEPTSA